MNFLEFVKGNNEGLLTIDKMRSVLKDFCHERIKDNEESATEEDIDKLSLMIEYNFFDGITSDDTEWDLNTISVDEVKFLIGSEVGFLLLLGGIEKNKRESYSELLDDITFHAVESVSDVINHESYFSKNVFDFYSICEGVYEGTYFNFGDEEKQNMLSEIYEYKLKNKIEM